MRFFIINTDYSGFINDFYAADPALVNKPYAVQHRARMNSLFGTADFYSHNLQALGHEAWDVIANLEPMQKQWARENDVRWGGEHTYELKLRRRVIPTLTRQPSRAWLHHILAEQIKAYRPDVIYCMAIETINSSFLQQVKGYYRIAIGQHAAPIPKCDLSGFDLMLSSLPNQVEHFRNLGLSSELFTFGFDPRVLTHLQQRTPRYDVVFVGSVGGAHQRGTQLLERLCIANGLRVWGHGLDQLAPDSPIRRRGSAPLWGVDMYQTLRDARIVVNRHIDIAGPYANNMRLYEATGTGSMLLTDAKINLPDLFEPQKHVAVYCNAQQCSELIDYYLSHESQRSTIAQGGQQHTLTVHNYRRRMAVLCELVDQRLQAKGTRHEYKQAA